MQNTYTEGRIQLAIQALDQKQIQSEKRAAEAYNVSRSTIRRRRAGAQPRRDSQPKSKKLTKLEEKVLVEHVLERDSRGWALTKKGVEEMANSLLAARSGKPVGKNWVDNFVNRTPEIRTQWSRSYDRQRALTEDPRVISPWFTLVQSFKEKYGIQDEDIYNFDETGFIIGIISS
jgi:Tc5 transposase DNA-binding domain